MYLISFYVFRFVAYTCYYGHVGNTGNIGNGNLFLPFVYGATMEMGVVFSIPLLLNKLGRKWTLLMMLLAATSFSCTFVFWPKGKNLQFSKLLCNTLVVKTRLVTL